MLRRVGSATSAKPFGGSYYPAFFELSLVVGVSERKAGCFSFEPCVDGDGDDEDGRWFKVVVGRPCRMGAMPGVLEVPGGSGGEEASPWAALAFASSVSSSKILCWLVGSATVVDGSQDWTCWAISLAICWVASFC